MEKENLNRRRADDAGEPMQIPAGALAEVTHTTQLGTDHWNRNDWAYPLVETGTICMVTGGPDRGVGMLIEQRYWVIVSIKGSLSKGWLYESELRQITSTDECE